MRARRRRWNENTLDFFSDAEHRMARRYQEIGGMGLIRSKTGFTRALI